MRSWIRKIQTQANSRLINILFDWLRKQLLRLPNNETAIAIYCETTIPNCLITWVIPTSAPLKPEHTLLLAKGHDLNALIKNDLTKIPFQNVIDQTPPSKYYPIITDELPLEMWHKNIPVGKPLSVMPEERANKEERELAKARAELKEYEERLARSEQGITEEDYQELLQRKAIEEDENETSRNELGDEETY
jgi:hypothetical protein